jgi:outer membrane protein assembly factor BamC
MKLIYIALIFSFLQLTACSYFFPDKEKDYVYSKEISALEIPPELRADKKSETQTVVSATQRSLTYEVVLVSEPEQTFLRINSSFAHVWRIVGKALTEVNVEITDKNREKSLYYVQYDPELQSAEKDGSYWQELVFMFGSDIHQELPYQIFLVAAEEGTHVFVRDESAKVLSEDKGLQLLRLIFDTINQDIKQKDNKNKT